MNLSNYIRIVLVEPSHPGNVGAIARSMANMGICDLSLINAQHTLDADAMRRASGADWILKRAKNFPSLDKAIEDCTLVFGTTSRVRAIDWPTLSPEQAMKKAVQQDARLAVVFGRERNGLENRELDLCNYMIRIDVDEEFPSMNLASAATILCYEFRKAVLNHESQTVELQNNELANSKQIAGMMQHLESTLQLVEFVDGRSSRLMRKLKRLFNRTQLTQEEVNILRGILTSVEQKFNR